MTGAELAQRLRIVARALGQNATFMEETKRELRALAAVLDPQDCVHEAYSSTQRGLIMSYRCLDCGHGWSSKL
jgi:hypothetical protein